MQNRISQLPQPSVTNFETTCCVSLLTEQNKQQVITLAWNCVKVKSCAFTVNSWRCFAYSESGRSPFLAPMK